MWSSGEFIEMVSLKMLYRRILSLQISFDSPFYSFIKTIVLNWTNSKKNANFLFTYLERFSFHIFIMRTLIFTELFFHSPNLLSKTLYNSDQNFSSNKLNDTEFYKCIRNEISNFHIREISVQLQFYRFP